MVMKYYLNFSIILGVLITLFACSNRDFKGSIEVEPVYYSKDYKPHLFEQDGRIEKIKEFAPEFQRLIEEKAEDRHIPGIAYGIVVDDELIIASSTGFINLRDSLPATTSSAFRIASMTKSFTALAILKLRDNGQLALSDPVLKYIPDMGKIEYLTSDSPPIRIENLMTMTAGFPEDNPWGDRQLDEPDQMLIDLINSGISFSNPPSFRFEYSNTGYAILGNIISRVSGIPYQQYIRENILQPLDMNDTYWEFEKIKNDQLALGYRWEDDQWKLEPILHDGSYGAMGGLITTIEDFSKYVSLHLSAWPPRNEPDTGPVKRSTLREMHTPQFSRLYANAEDWDGNPCPGQSGYGYGLGIYKNCNGFIEVAHGGALPGYGSHYAFYPEYGVGIMAFGNLTYTRPYDKDLMLKVLIEKAGIKPRELPVSDILKTRQEQVFQMIQTWDEDLEAEILAENFYLDKSRAHRKAEIEEILDNAGEIRNSEDIWALNQLRGGFDVITENGIISVFFTLTPEKDPKVQALYLSFEEKSSE
jgi:CubicO group peptidase (beta-lactamase class C family)